MPHSTAANNRPTQAAIIPPASRWSVSQRRGASSTYRIPTPRRTPHRSAEPPYYNNVYKGAGVRPCYESMPDGAAYHRPCQPGGVDRWQVLHPAHLLRGQCLHLYSVNPATVSTLLTPGGLRSNAGPAVRAHRLAPSTRRGSPAAGTRRAARNHWRLSPQLFSGFRPIANKGQQ